MGRKGGKTGSGVKVGGKRGKGRKTGENAKKGEGREGEVEMGGKGGRPSKAKCN